MMILEKEINQINCQDIKDEGVQMGRVDITKEVTLKNEIQKR